MSQGLAAFVLGWTSIDIIVATPDQLTALVFTVGVSKLLPGYSFQQAHRSLSSINTRSRLSFVSQKDAIYRTHDRGNGDLISTTLSPIEIASYWSALIRAFLSAQVHTISCSIHLPCVFDTGFQSPRVQRQQRNVPHADSYLLRPQGMRQCISSRSSKLRQRYAAKNTRLG